MDRQPRLSAVAMVAAVMAVAVVAEVAVAEEKQMVVAWMREMSLLMEVSYLNRSKR